MINVEEHLGLARQAAGRFWNEFRPPVDLEDVVSEAFIGLMKAARMFDPSKGTAFTTFAGMKIRYHLLDWLREQSWISRSELAKVRAGKAVMHAVLSLSVPVSVGGYGDLMPLEDALGDVDDNLAQIERRDEVKAMIRRLPRKQRQVLEGYYLGEQTMREVAMDLDLSESRVSQLHGDAMRELAELREQSR